MAFHVLMYGSDNWSLSLSHKRKIEAAEMRFWDQRQDIHFWTRKEVPT